MQKSGPKVSQSTIYIKYGLDTDERFECLIGNGVPVDLGCWGATENRVKPGRGSHSFFHSYCTVSFLLHRLEVVQSYAPLTPGQNAHTTVSVTQPFGSNRRARSAAVPLRAGTYRR